MMVGVRQKLVLFFLFVVAYTLLYILPNFFPPFQPSFLPLLPIDRAVPLVPWTFLIYLSLYALELLTIWLVWEAEDFFAFSRMAFATLIICGFFFVFFPTQYPRPPYPQVSNPIVALAMSIVGRADKPTNCFPSMHVATTSIATWILRRKGRGVCLFFGLWSVAIFVSTLTTKQHYFVDVMGGLVVAVAVATAEHFLATRAGLEPIKAMASRKDLS